MRRTTLAAVIVVAVGAVPLFAAQRTFVSTSGLDTNTCGHNDPCRTFGAAIAQTSASGEVIALDSGGYGAFTITQAVTVMAPNGVYAGISVLSGDGVAVNTSGFTTLRNLSINGQGGTNGVNVTNAGTLSVDGCAVANLPAGVAVNAPGANVVVSGSRFANDGNGIALTAAEALVVEHSNFAAGTGVVIDSGNVVIRDSTATGGSYGFYVRGATAAPYVVLDSCVTTQTGNSGVRLESGTLIIHGGSILAHSGGDAGVDVISATAAANITLDGVTIAHGYYGIRLYGFGTGTVAASISNCSITDAHTGIVVQASPTVVRLAHSVITRNALGVDNTGAIYTASDNTISGNTTETSGATFIAITLK